MTKLLIMLTAIGFSAYTARSMLLWITSGEDDPGEWENPLLNLDESEVGFKKVGNSLVVSINLSKPEEKCIQITSKHHNDTMHILVQQAEPLDGFRRQMYSLTSKDGKYSHSLKLSPSITRVRYGPEAIEVLLV